MKAITENQVHSVHKLLKFMRKLRIIGLIETRVTSYPMSEDGGINYRLYDVDVHQYFPGVYKTKDDEMDNMIKYSIALDLYDDY